MDFSPQRHLMTLLAATRVSLGASRLVVTIPIYVLLGAIMVIPLGFFAYLVLPFNPERSLFDSFLGDVLATPSGTVQSAATYFYFYLYLMSYLTMASVIGYEERRDRSIIFWKSLPIGDGAWVIGQIVALFVAFLIGSACLAAICTVLTVWEYAYLSGLNIPHPGLISILGQTYATLFEFFLFALLILLLSMPFGMSMLWFATFCRRQPGGVWLGTFVSIYLVLFLLRYIGIEVVEPLLWYPESFGRVVFWLLGFGRLPEELKNDLLAMFMTSAFATVFFAYLTYRARQRAMPVS